MITTCEVKLDLSFLVWFCRIAFRTCLVFRYVSYCMFITKLVLLQRGFIASFDDGFKAVRRTVWHCWNLTE